MFNWFRKKSNLEKLESNYKNLLEQAFRLSKTNRKLSDAKTAEANIILEQIEDLRKGKP